MPYRAIYLNTKVRHEQTFQTLKEAYAWCVPQDETEWHRLLYTEVAKRSLNNALQEPMLVSYNDPERPQWHSEAYFIQAVPSENEIGGDVRLPQLSRAVPLVNSN
jgi:hypothetical protein